MSEVAVPFHSANSALVAVVVISLNPVVKEVAYGAKVGGELGAAANACVGHGLSFITRSAHHFFDRMPVHFMALGIIVAMTTHIRFVTTWCDKAASAHVMLASYFFDYVFVSFVCGTHGFIFVKVVKVAHDQ